MPAELWLETLFTINDSRRRQLHAALGIVVALVRGVGLDADAAKYVAWSVEAKPSMIGFALSATLTVSALCTTYLLLSRRGVP